MPTPRGLVQQLDQRLHKSQLLPRGARLLIAVSGGADSVALLHLLHRINQSKYWNWSLVIGHVDHGIRGRASVADARFVSRLAKSLRLPVTVKKLNLPAKTSEDRARQARLDALAAMARAKRCEAAVMAHHADDQAETVLMRIFRGCGIDGLSGIARSSEVRGLRILRPLLEISRKELRDYLQQNAYLWQEDSTNTSHDYLRNRVRSTLIPDIQKLWPQAVPALCRLAALAAETQATISQRSGHLLQFAHRPRQNAIALSRRRFRQVPPPVASDALRQIIEALGGSVENATYERLQEAMKLIQSNAGGKQIDMGRHIVLRADADNVTLSRERATRRISKK